MIKKVRSSLSNIAHRVGKALPVAKVQPDIKGKKYYLCEDLFVNINGWCIDIPRGTRTDGMSIPRLFWTLTGYHPFHPKCLTASVVHDFIFTPLAMSQKEADRVFRDILVAQGVSSRRANIAMFALQVGGWVTYKHRGVLSTKKLEKMVKENPEQYEHLKEYYTNRVYRSTEPFQLNG